MWDIVRLLPVLIAAVILGNWFMKELQIARAKQAPWYAPYKTLPGIIILVCIIGLPLLVWLLQ